ncbi:hypothetical protein O181_043243 [Austropuccinia psidii MF-1]|uniref:Secreted protein n=1 Tax=Austropuccinia psidii MF-1 TaxID=1389203 RepID=A0A9Q3HFH7_9BASI|nr:hypothetical protein [Austropuccinia psidii MF-1]
MKILILNILTLLIYYSKAQEAQDSVKKLQKSDDAVGHLIDELVQAAQKDDILQIYDLAGKAYNQERFQDRLRDQIFPHFNTTNAAPLINQLADQAAYRAMALITQIFYNAYYSDVVLVLCGQLREATLASDFIFDILTQNNGTIQNST